MNTTDELVNDIADRYTSGWIVDGIFIYAHIIPEERKELEGYLRLLLGGLELDGIDTASGLFGIKDSNKWIIYDGGTLISQEELTTVLQRVMGENNEGKSEK